MTRLLRQKSTTGIYHVMFRGANKSFIFQQHTAKQKLIEFLVDAKEKSSCLLLAYCIMDNHVHLLMKEGDEAIGNTIRRVKLRFTKWFNFTHDRLNSLFGDRFRSEPVDDDNYLLAVIAYIFRNPVVAKLCHLPGDYKWSSYRELADDAKDGITDKCFLLNLLRAEAIIEYSNSSKIEELFENKSGSF